MLRRPITVREVNRYLSPVVQELQEKHGGVSSPEFEKALTARTGIGWKQVKNYRNHPQPGQVVKDNAIIKDFIYACRGRELRRRLRSPLWISVCTLAAAAFLFGTIRLVRTYERYHSRWVPRSVARNYGQPQPIARLSEGAADWVKHPRVFLDARELGVALHLGKFDPKQGVYAKLQCHPSTYMDTCLYTDIRSKTSTTMELLTQKGSIFSLSLITSDRALIATLQSELKKSLPPDFKYDPEKKAWFSNTEVLQFDDKFVIGQMPALKLVLFPKKS